MSPSGTDPSCIPRPTECSMLDGASLLDGVVQPGQRPGTSSIAMTDHGNLHGPTTSGARPKKVGVKPIIGIEAYVTQAPPAGEPQTVRWGRATAGEGGNDVAGGGAYTPA